MRVEIKAQKLIVGRPEEKACLEDPVIKGVII
jgi:hypothetical protein